MPNRLLLAAVLALVLSACASTTQLTTTTAFDPTAAAFINTQGKGTVTGQAFMRRNDGVVVYAAGSNVFLVPKTAYSDERMTAIYGTGHFATFGVQFKNDDPNYYKFLRQIIADGEGKFSFSGVADGNYYLVTSVTWNAGDEPQGGTLSFPVTVAGGKPVNVIMSD